TKGSERERRVDPFHMPTELADGLGSESAPWIAAILGQREESQTFPRIPRIAHPIRPCRTYDLTCETIRSTASSNLQQIHRFDAAGFSAPTQSWVGLGGSSGGDFKKTDKH